MFSILGQRSEKDQPSESDGSRSRSQFGSGEVQTGLGQGFEDSQVVAYSGKIIKTVLDFMHYLDFCKRIIRHF